MGRNVVAKKVINGIKFDSQTEALFWERYNHTGIKRNEESFDVWVGEHTGEVIRAVPDFIGANGEWIEIKGRVEDSFALKVKLVREYCKTNGISYSVLMLHQNKFVKWEDLKNIKTTTRLDQQGQLIHIWNLIYVRKTLKETELSTLLDLLISPKSEWVAYRGKRMAQKKKTLIQLRAKLLSTPLDKMTKLRQLINK